MQGSFKKEMILKISTFLVPLAYVIRCDKCDRCMIPLEPSVSILAAVVDEGCFVYSVIRLSYF